VIERAQAMGGESVLYTFEPHPRKVLQPDRPPRLLATFEQKLELLEAVGIDVVIAEPFDLEFAKTEPEIFVNEYVHRKIQPKEVYVGYDFHFGRDREGSMRLLTETGPQLGFSVTIIPEVKVGGEDLNSTRIRALLTEGHVEEAASLLGRPFGVRAVVVGGMRRGREIGFPTANLAPENEILPGPGVYVCQIKILKDARGVAISQSHGAVTNVGYRPTFEDGRDLVAEAHLIDFSGDLYDFEVELSFLKLIREEERFDSVEGLKQQIGRDVDAGRAFLQGRPKADLPL
jgi:riboflavin kinase/FMN adenylyltransferase